MRVPSSRVALACALVGVALTALGAHLVKPAGPGEAGMVVRSSADARYDAASDTTLVVFSCHPRLCSPGYIVAGDVRAAVADGPVRLRAPSPEVWRVVEVEPYEAPLEAVPSPGREGTVTEAYAGPFEVVSGGHGIGTLITGLVLVAAAAGAASHHLRWTPVWASGFAIALGVLWGTTAARGGGNGIFVAWPIIFLFPLAVGLVTPERTRRFGVPLTIATGLAGGIWVFGHPFFPTGYII